MDNTRKINVYSVNNKDLCSFSRVYADGQAKNTLGYDLVYFTKPDFNYLIDKVKEKNKEVFSINIIDKNNKVFDGLMYLWQEKSNRENGLVSSNYYTGFMGLVVQNGDIKSINNAAIKYLQEVQIL